MQIIGTKIIDASLASGTNLLAADYQRCQVMLFANSSSSKDPQTRSMPAFLKQGDISQASML